MPDYFGDWPHGYKPSDKEVNDRMANEHKEKQKARVEGAKVHAQELKKPGPAERVYGQDRFVNTYQGEVKERSSKRPELTPAQQEMRAKRETARAEAVKQIGIKDHDKSYPVLQKKDQTPSR